MAKKKSTETTFVWEGDATHVKLDNKWYRVVPDRTYKIVPDKSAKAPLHRPSADAPVEMSASLKQALLDRQAEDAARKAALAAGDVV